MTHGQLDGARTDPGMHAVGGVTVAEFVRKNRDAELTSGLLDGALDIGLVHPVTDFKVGAGMEAGAMRRKEPRPGPRELVFGVFGGELMGQCDRDFILPIPVPDRLGELHLLDEFRYQYFGEGNNTVFAALGPDEKERELIQIEVFDAQVERLADTQPAAVDQSGNEIGGISGPIPNGLEQGLGFRNGGRMPQAGRPFGSKRIHVLKWLTQDLFVKIQDGVEGLVLAVGGQITMSGQIS